MGNRPRGIYLEEYEIGKEYVTGVRTITEADGVCPYTPVSFQGRTWLF